MKQLLDSDCRLSIRDVVDKLSIMRETIRLILKDKLRLQKLCAKLFPKNLTEEQKKCRVDVCRDWLEAVESENILKRVITCDESWLFEYDPETKRQSMQWVDEGEVRLKKAWMSKLEVKIMFVAFFDKKGLIHKEFLPQKTTSSDISANEFVVFSLSCGQTTPGCSTKTTHPCTLPLKFATFSAKD